MCKGKYDLKPKKGKLTLKGKAVGNLKEVNFVGKPTALKGKTKKVKY